MSILAVLLALPAIPVQDFLTLQHAPVADMLRHPKDASLARLFQLAPAVAQRFAAEQGQNLPPEILALALDLLGSAKTLAIGEHVVAEGEFPIRASLAITAPDEAAAQRRMDFLGQLMAGAGVELGAPLASGLHPLHAPAPVFLAMGRLGRDLTLTVGTDVVSHPAPVAAGLPPGVAPWLQLEVRESELRSAITRLAEMQGQGAQADAFFDVMNLTSLRTAVGSDGSRLWSASHAPLAAAEMRAHGALAGGALPPSTLARIPADAHFAVAARVNLMGVFTYMEAEVQRLSDAAGANMVDLRTELANEVGFDVVGEILPHFGPTFGMYLSDTTGGGTLLSMVAFAELQDVAAVENLTTRLTALLAEDGQAPVSVRKFDSDGFPCTSVVVPGLPFPFVPTWVVDGGFVYLGLSPQAAIAAAEAARAGGGLPQNPRFQAAMAGIELGKDEFAVTFVDLPELLRDGYAYGSLVMDALGNLARSSDGSDGLARLMPSYGELARDARASAAVSRISGDDTVSLATTDASVLVNMVGLLGILDRSGLMALIQLAAVGAQAERNASIDWDAEMEWKEPLVEGGSLIELVDYMQTDAVDPVGAVHAQLEVHLDSNAGALTIYVVDADVTGYVRNAQEAFVMTVFPEEGEPYDLTLRQVANEATGESIGDSATYRVEDARLAGLPYLSGQVQSITVTGATFEAASIWALAP